MIFFQNCKFPASLLFEGVICSISQPDLGEWMKTDELSGALCLNRCALGPSCDRNHKSMSMTGNNEPWIQSRFNVSAIYKHLDSAEKSFMKI